MQGTGSKSSMRMMSDLTVPEQETADLGAALGNQSETPHNVGAQAVDHVEAQMNHPGWPGTCHTK